MRLILEKRKQTDDVPLLLRLEPLASSQGKGVEHSEGLAGSPGRNSGGCRFGHN